MPEGAAAAAVFELQKLQPEVIRPCLSAVIVALPIALRALCFLGRSASRDNVVMFAGGDRSGCDSLRYRRGHPEVSCSLLGPC